MDPDNVRHHNGSYCGTVNKYCRSLGCEITRRLICGIEAAPAID